MLLTKSDITDALKLRAFVLRFNINQVTDPLTRRLAKEELDAIETRLFDEDCLQLKLAAFISNPSEEEPKVEEKPIPSFIKTSNLLSIVPNKQRYLLNVVEAEG